ncbi:hypothetical protein [Salinimicrobium sediminilitoris]|uniref:hypothetical protein n=1 Tax=Salinimicrobium sediminilitoris TaxID=2876715 RepID=UPI001E305DFA|nr:hypothetical protein [Salinimicrobium sediminilitoris]MCC8360271.1 hypothetical protein [Salinimicrobium sediminilitoris]
MTKTVLLTRLNYIFDKAEAALATGQASPMEGVTLKMAESRGFSTSGLSFILDLYGDKHPYYVGFQNATKYHYETSVRSGIEILDNIKAEIENGWLNSIKSIVSAEIFSDFLEMAEHLLKNDYKDASAVMLGSVLEEKLRQLSELHKLPIKKLTESGKEFPVNADRLNNELAKAEVYNKLEQKTVTAHLDLRNKAAHGHYNEYDKSQVNLMYDYVLNFVAKYN